MSDSSEGTIAGIFTSRLVGGLFAVAFGAWAIVLGSVKSDIVNTQTAIQRDIAELKNSVAAHAIYSAEKTAVFEANHREMERRVAAIESRHRNGTKHTVESDGVE